MRRPRTNDDGADEKLPRSTSIRLDVDDIELLERLEKHLGLMRSAVFRQALRVLARKEGLLPE